MSIKKIMTQPNKAAIVSRIGLSLGIVVARSLKDRFCGESDISNPDFGKQFRSSTRLEVKAGLEKSASRGGWAFRLHGIGGNHQVRNWERPIRAVRARGRLIPGVPRCGQ